MKTALITGITGQDGSYLAEHLLDEGYKVYGLVRQTSVRNLERITHLADRVEIVNGDLLDQNSLINAVAESRPDEVYNLAAQSFVPASFSQPVLTGEFTALGVTRMLEAIRVVNPKIRFYQASSSEMFGKAEAVPQDEQTKFHPRSPYGVAKVYGHWITVNFRESYVAATSSGATASWTSSMEIVPTNRREAWASVHDGRLLRTRSRSRTPAPAGPRFAS